jgi:hypothetical protein
MGLVEVSLTTDAAGGAGAGICGGAGAANGGAAGTANCGGAAAGIGGAAGACGLAKSRVYSLGPADALGAATGGEGAPIGGCGIASGRPKIAVKLPLCSETGADAGSEGGFRCPSIPGLAGAA